jgi:hypothetical protein
MFQHRLELLAPDPSDPLLPVVTVAAAVLGRAAHKRTYAKSIEKGIKIKGRVVKLVAIRDGGGGWKTTRRAFVAYLEAINADVTPAAESLRSPAKRQRATAKAAAELKAMGA